MVQEGSVNGLSPQGSSLDFEEHNDQDASNRTSVESCAARKSANATMTFCIKIAITDCLWRELRRGVQCGNRPEAENVVGMS